MAKNIIFWNRADASLENNGLYLSHPSQHQALLVLNYVFARGVHLLLLLLLLLWVHLVLL